MRIESGAVDRSVELEILGADGLGVTGLVYNSSGLILGYARPRSAFVAVSLVTLAAVTTAHADGGFKEIDATSWPGWYRFDLPDAAVAAGVDNVSVGGKYTGAAGCYIPKIGVDLTTDAASLTTLLARLTGPRASALDNLDATVSSRASATNMATVLTALSDIYGKIDTEIAQIVTLLTSTGVPLTAAAVDAIWDEVIGGVLTARQSMRLQNAGIFGLASGLNTQNPKYRDPANTIDAITCASDQYGNRTSVTLNVSA